MRTRRVHITGASGAGVTTLGRALAGALAIPHHDTDDYYWLPTSPPFRTPRPVADRLRLMREMFLDRAAWALSGSLDRWGDPIMESVDLTVFVQTPTEIRLRRLRAREALRHGAEAVAPGGWRHAETEAFLVWASHYDDGSIGSRHLARHETWLARLACPVLRVDGTRAVAALVADVEAALAVQANREGT
jgi:adenylate kinase family enzyme